MLKIMLNETCLENLRQALVTLNSAVVNKPQLVLPHLSQLLPLLMKETVVHPELIREVSMGPFKVKIDDGTSTRQVRHLTFSCMIESAWNMVSIDYCYRAHTRHFLRCKRQLWHVYQLPNWKTGSLLDFRMSTRSLCCAH